MLGRDPDRCTLDLTKITRLRAVYMTKSYL